MIVEDIVGLATKIFDDHEVSGARQLRAAGRL